MPGKEEDLAYMILSVVEEIPAGRVLSRSEFYGDYPCHRVVNHKGRTAPGWREQRSLLEAEGVSFRDENHVDMEACSWLG